MIYVSVSRVYRRGNLVETGYIKIPTLADFGSAPQDIASVLEMLLADVCTSVPELHAMSMWFNPVDGQIGGGGYTTPSVEFDIFTNTKQSFRVSSGELWLSWPGFGEGYRTDTLWNRLHITQESSVIEVTDALVTYGRSMLAVLRDGINCTGAVVQSPLLI
jgi:hypothetical protein